MIGQLALQPIEQHAARHRRDSWQPGLSLVSAGRLDGGEELAERGDLFDFIANTGGLSEFFARRVMFQLFNAINYMHLKGIVHRDIKLENIVLDRDFNIKIIDFGMSSSYLNKDGTLFHSQVCGTHGYMAPELEASQKYQGIQVDMFALGVLMFIIIAGR